MESKYIFGVSLPEHVLGEAVPLEGIRTQGVLEIGETHFRKDFGDFQR